MFLLTDSAGPSLSSAINNVHNLAAPKWSGASPWSVILA